MPTGRNSKLTPEMQERICGFIAAGNTFERSCRLCDICDKTFYLWKALGSKTGSGRYFDFLQAVKKAEERFIAWNIQQIMSAAKEGKQWTASAWLLERKYRAEFGQHQQLEHSGSLEITSMTPDERAAEITRLLDKRNAK